MKEICPHESVKHPREHYRRNRQLNQFCHGPISNIEEIQMAVLDTTQYELVVASEFPGNARYISRVSCQKGPIRHA